MTEVLIMNPRMLKHAIFSYAESLEQLDGHIFFDIHGCPLDLSEDRWGDINTVLVPTSGAPRLLQAVQIQAYPVKSMLPLIFVDCGTKRASMVFILLPREEAP